MWIRFVFQLLILFAMSVVGATLLQFLVFLLQHSKEERRDFFVGKTFDAKNFIRNILRRVI